MNNDIILFLVIEGNRNKGCGGTSVQKNEESSRLLEDECLNFLKCWYSDRNEQYSTIPTYLICPSFNPPSDSFLLKIKTCYKLVNYIYTPHDISNTFPAGWFNTPLAGKWLEDNIKYKKAIHLDLDMLLLKPFDDKFLIMCDDHIANIATYTKSHPDDVTHMNNIPKTFITCFIVSTYVGKFYTQWWNMQFKIQKQYEKKYDVKKLNRSSSLWWEYCNIEEHSVDVLYYENKCKITMLPNSQFGTTSGYGQIHEYDVEDIFFLHAHINELTRCQDINEYVKAQISSK